jgi:rhodanese-related sulfurtransferase
MDKRCLPNWRAAMCALFLAVVLVVTLVLPGCGSGALQTRDSRDMPDADKRAAIEEMITGYRPEYPDAPELTVPELVERMASEDILLVDVRETAEQGVSMIPGAISVSQFEEKKAEHMGRTIVAYCTIGLRSGKCVQDLHKEGFNAYNLHGSILAWAHAGRPLADPSGSETRHVHVYGTEWNLLPQGYTPVW